MKKNFKRTLAKVMAVALTVSMVGVASTDADAAKKIKLSSKSISVAKGATKKVTIKNVKAKKVKKLTVKSKNKKIATVKKAGKTAFKVTGKKAGKSTKVTVKVKVGKKTTKLTLKVKVTKAAKKVVPTTAPTTAPTAAPTAAASATPAATATAKASAAPKTTPSATPAAKPDESATPVPVAPTQPPKPTSPAKQMPELNLREEAATEWATAGSYGTAIFNTDDTIDYSSQPWAAEGSCYNNGIAWYIDPAKKGKVDLTAYTDLELTIKTDAEIKFMTWGGSSDAKSFWDKNDSWGAASKTVENADGSKTITYNLEKIFGSATKVKKAVAVGLTLKSDKDGDDNAFSARTATIYGIKFVNNGGAGTDTGKTETGKTETGKSETGSTESKPSVVPTDINVPLTNETVVKVKAYGADPELTVANGVVTTTAVNEACMGIKITIPEGLKLSDYYGISFDVINTGSAEISGKRFLVEAKGNDADGLTRVTKRDGSKNINIFTSEMVSGLAVGNTTTVTGAFTNLNKITYDLTGTITLALDSNYRIESGGYAIKNVKLLAKNPSK